MRCLLPAFALALSTVSSFADNVLKDIVSDRDVQMVLVVDLRNQQMRQQLNAAQMQQVAAAIAAKKRRR